MGKGTSSLFSPIFSYMFLKLEKNVTIEKWNECDYIYLYNSMVYEHECMIGSVRGWDVKTPSQHQRICGEADALLTTTVRQSVSRQRSFWKSKDYMI